MIYIYILYIYIFVYITWFSCSNLLIVDKPRFTLCHGNQEPRWPRCSHRRALRRAAAAQGVDRGENMQDSTGKAECHELWPWLSLIKLYIIGDFSGIIHSINGVISTCNWYNSGHNCRSHYNVIITSRYMSPNRLTRGKGCSAKPLNLIQKRLFGGSLMVCSRTLLLSTSLLLSVSQYVCEIV